MKNPLKAIDVVHKKSFGISIPTRATKTNQPKDKRLIHLNISKTLI